MNIKIIDAGCGEGKTTYAQTMINSNPEKSYVFITPYIDEVNNMKDKRCPMANFKQPTQRGEGKFGDFHKLLVQGDNIASTHALFQRSTRETMDLIESHDYTLILDEVMNVLEELPLKKDDLPMILSQSLAHVDDGGFLVWDKAEYDGRYNDVKIMCGNRSLFVVNDCVLMWTFPAEIFKCFREVYVLTYMFSAQIQRYYYDLHGIKYEYYSVAMNDDGYTARLMPYIENAKKPKGSIEIYEGKLNGIGDGDTALSKSWYIKNRSTKLEVLRNNVYNYFNNIQSSKSKFNLWTTFKDYKCKVSGKGYSRGFLSSNARATNEYRDRSCVAYVINKFISPILVSFFARHGITVNQDDFAVSELVQFIYRSALRDDKKITLYIPSERMRTLLKQWLLHWK